MNRLTRKDEKGNLIPLESEKSGWWVLVGDFYKRLYGDAADRLAAYEDTGLMPEEVQQYHAEAIGGREIIKTLIANAVLHAEQENKALTEEELMLCVGEPVYICDNSVCRFPLEPCWVILERLVNDGKSVRFEGQHPDQLLADYGKTWTAYRHKPKEEV
jgi:hypothetical protein